MMTELSEDWANLVRQWEKPARNALAAAVEGPPEATDVVAFARERLGVDPDEKQEMVLRGGRRVILNCRREWGKSTVAAAKAVHRAFTRPGSLSLALGPSLRQSGEFVRKVEEFARRLGIAERGDGLNRVSIQFP